MQLPLQKVDTTMLFVIKKKTFLATYLARHSVESLNVNLQFLITRYRGKARTL